MRTENFINGLNVLKGYRIDKNGFNIGCTSDIFYAYATDLPLSDEAVNNLIEWGWTQEHAGRDYGKDFSVSEYRPDETWCAYL